MHELTHIFQRIYPKNKCTYQRNLMKKMVEWHIALVHFNSSRNEFLSINYRKKWDSNVNA